MLERLQGMVKAFMGSYRILKLESADHCRQPQLKAERAFHSVEPVARRLLCAISLVILLVMIALHFGLVDLGQWHFDEFSVIGSYRDNGWTAFIDRFVGWSPRPISEVLIWVYACLVNWIHKPLIGVFLGLLWLPLIAAPLISFLQIRKTFSEDSRQPLAFLSLFSFTLLALFLLGHSPGDLFYWPMAAAAYLTTLGAITLCFFQIAFRLTDYRLGRVVTSLSLIFAAGTSETGAFFALVFSVLSFTCMSIDAFCGSTFQRRFLWHLIPAVVAIGVFGLLMQNRVRNQEAILPTVEYHSVYLSLKAAIGQTLKECLVAGQRLSTRSVIFGLALKVCIFIGIRYCWLASGFKMPRRQVLIVFALSIIATTYFSVAASYYGFGIQINDRHHELRQCLIILLIASVVLLSCHYYAPICEIGRCEWLGGIFILVSLVFVVPGRFSALVHDYRNYSVCIENRINSWNSGLSEGNTMIWLSSPQGEVASKNAIAAAGMYNLKSNPPPWAVPMMQFFRKEHLEIRLGGAKSNR
jgi:hypothetical protein